MSIKNSSKGSIGHGYDGVPERILRAINAHVRCGQETGHFVTAVLSNDLNGAIARGDYECLSAIKLIVQYVYNRCPGSCWGSSEKTKAWRRSGGAEGLKRSRGELFDLSELIGIEEE